MSKQTCIPTGDLDRAQRAAVHRQAGRVLVDAIVVDGHTHPGGSLVFSGLSNRPPARYVFRELQPADEEREGVGIEDIPGLIAALHERDDCGIGELPDEEERQEANCKATSLTRAAILAACPAIVRVHIAALDGDVFVREMSGAERDAFDAWQSAGKRTSAEILCELVVRCICDEVGEPMFSAEDAAKVARLKARVMLELGQAVSRHNRLTADDEQELLGNSASGASDAPGLC